MAPGRKRGKAAAARQEWKVGDLVLAKVKGFPAWPAQISTPEKWGQSHDPRKVFVYFFGTDQIGFCSPDAIQAFTQETKKHLSSKCQGKGTDFVRAVEQIVEVYEKLNMERQEDGQNTVDEEVKIDGRRGSTRKLQGKKGNRSQASQYPPEFLNVVPDAEEDSYTQRDQAFVAKGKDIENRIQGLEDLQKIAKVGTDRKASNDQNNQISSVNKSVKKRGRLLSENHNIQKRKPPRRIPKSEPEMSENRKNNNICAQATKVKQDIKNKKRGVKKLADSKDLCQDDGDEGAIISRGNLFQNDGDEGAIISLGQDEKAFRFPVRTSDIDLNKSEVEVQDKIPSEGGTQLQGESWKTNDASEVLKSLGDGQMEAIRIPTNQNVTGSNEGVEHREALQDMQVNFASHEKNSVASPFIDEDDGDRAIIDDRVQHIYVLKKKRKHLKKCDLGLYGPGRRFMDFGNERVTSTEIEASGCLTKSHELESKAKGVDHKLDTDEHLPLVKRVRARLRKESSKTQENLNEDNMPKAVEGTADKHALQDAFPSDDANCKSSVLMASETTHPERASSHCADSAVLGEKEPCLPRKADKYRLRGSLADDETALPPSKRIHRALEAMSAYAAEAASVSDEVDATSMETQDDGKTVSVCMNSGNDDVSRTEDHAKGGDLFVQKDSTGETRISEMCIDSCKLVSEVSSEPSNLSEEKVGSFAEADIRSDMHGDQSKIDIQDDRIIHANSAEKSIVTSQKIEESKKHEKSFKLRPRKNDGLKFSLQCTGQTEGNTYDILDTNLKSHLQDNRNREAAHTRICERARHRQNQDTVPKELRSAPAAEETEESSCWFESVELRKMGMDAGDSPSRITVGVCVMQKKVLSAPMTQILDRLKAFGEFEIIIFGDKVILEEPMKKWPICDCLIAFYSTGYPLEKAEAYAALRKPFLVNELGPQHLLHDRRKVYERLQKFGIPTPSYALVNRDYPYQELDYFVEQEDFVEVNGKRILKPFVEKPVHGDDHSVMIYYPSSAGGGMKELFRKVGNRSSEFHPDVRKVRREGSYIYEEFMPTGGTDVKVYTVGPDYAHAEARKSPVVDGVVMRSPDGKEVRYPVLLTPTEKQMAREVCIGFGQGVCGFDLLRCQGRSYVCDVNGWSFVKNSYKYYDDAACVLRKMFLDAKAPHLSSALPPTLPWKVAEPTQPSGLARQGSSIIGTFGQSEELRCVIAVVRHGDRTPKQKVKLKVTQEKLLNLMLKYNGGRPRAETKLKSAIQLQDLLDATRMLVPRARSGRESDSDAEDLEHTEKLRHVKAVLEEGGHFSGIYRKVQLKPQKWVKVLKENGEGEEERPVEALMVLKYGGVLTHAGRKQAEELGRYFRNNMYPGEGTGLLRLHSTYRHDLKIYSSDEGRVQMSAAAFAKGLLDLEGQLTPILVSLVSKDSSMLDGLDNASIEMEEAKARLYEIITSGNKKSNAPVNEEIPWMVDAAGLPINARELLPRMAALTKKVTAQVKQLAKDEEESLAETTSDEALPPYDQAKALGKTNMDVDRIAAGLPCGSEGFLLMFARWKKLERDLYNERKDRFDITQIPDVYDSCKYDLIHNAHLHLDGLDELFKVTQLLADGVIPNEYGINPEHKLKIGSKIARRLLGKILIDLRNTRQEALSVAELKHSQESSDISSNFGDDECDSAKRCRRMSDDSRKSNEQALDPEDHDGKETQYRLDPKYANVKTPERHVRTRLYFTSESHIHSLMNVLRYCNLDDSLEGERSLVCDAALQRLYKTRELDYMAYIVLRMFENTAVALEDPRRFRIELTYSSGAGLSPLEASPRYRDHTLPIMGPERLQEADSCLTLDKLENMMCPFAMPAEDFPPAAAPQAFSGLFTKSSGVLERLVNLWPFHKQANGKAS